MKLSTTYYFGKVFETLCVYHHLPSLFLTMLVSVSSLNFQNSTTQKLGTQTTFTTHSIVFFWGHEENHRITPAAPPWAAGVIRCFSSCVPVSDFYWLKTSPVPFFLFNHQIMPLILLTKNPVCSSCSPGCREYTVSRLNRSCDPGRTPPVRSVAPCPARGLSFDRFPRPWPQSKKKSKSKVI